MSKFHSILVCSVMAMVLCFELASCGSGGGGNPKPSPSNPVPSIASLSPSSVAAGAAAQTLTINGSNFISSSTVTYNAAPHAATFVSSSQLTISLNADDQATGGLYPVVVTNPAPGGGASNSKDFAVDNPQPTISSLSPSIVASQSPDTTITIGGSGFVAASVVAFGATKLPVASVSATQLTATIPSSSLTAAAIYQLTVSNPAPGGGASSGLPFYVVASQSATTGSDGTVQFQNPNLKVSVVDVTSNQPLSNSQVQLFEDGTNDGIVIVDSTGKFAPYLRGFAASSAPAAISAELTPAAYIAGDNTFGSSAFPLDLLNQVLLSDPTISVAETGPQIDSQVSQMGKELLKHILECMTIDQNQCDMIEADVTPESIGGALGIVAVGAALALQAKGYTPSQNISLTSSQAGSTGLLASIPLEAPATEPPATAGVTGKVTDAATGLPLAGAPVDLAGPSTQVVHTDTNGNFTASGLLPGLYGVRVSSPGYLPSGTMITLSSGQQAATTIEIAPFAGASQPFIESVTPILAQTGQGIIITGSGFGSTPPQTAPLGDGSVDTQACNVSTPSLAIWDNGRSSTWAAGRDSCTNSDLIGIMIASWTDTQIVLNGFGSALGDSSSPSTYNIAPGDSLTVVVFGPNNAGLATYNLQVSAATPLPLTGATTVQVQPNQPFTDTGISLNAGDNVTITASGMVTFTTDGHIPPFSPAGFPPNCTAGEVYGQANLSAFPNAQLPCWSLIGQIGDGPIFEVGTGTAFQAQASGELYLGVNDNYLPDNSGGWTASVAVAPKNP